MMRTKILNSIEWLEKQFCIGSIPHDYEQKYIYLENATDVTPYCKCQRCGIEKDGWLEKLSKAKLDTNIIDRIDELINELNIIKQEFLSRG